MRTTLLAVLTFASVGYAASAFAQAQAPAPEPAAATAQPAEEPKICMDVDAGGNSRLVSRKVCRTQKEWDARAHGHK